ncbi:hypothetical protein EDB89DRAFT_1907167 [Lactarius sanguifluus]|nr:hypothetical protein EDB89DRAFT_1907167 [Lactarius sanguifluus]
MFPITRMSQGAVWPLGGGFSPLPQCLHLTAYNLKPVARDVNELSSNECTRECDSFVTSTRAREYSFPRRSQSVSVPLSEPIGWRVASLRHRLVVVIPLVVPVVDHRPAFFVVRSKWLGLVGDSQEIIQPCFLWPRLPTLNVQDYDIHNHANACPVPNTTTTAYHGHPNDDYDTAGRGNNDDDTPTTVQNNSKTGSNNNDNAIDINDERRQDGKPSSNDDDDAIDGGSGAAITRQVTAVTRMR